jgi:hypothetical protein
MMNEVTSCPPEYIWSSALIVERNLTSTGAIVDRPIVEERESARRALLTKRVSEKEDELTEYKR